MFEKLTFASPREKEDFEKYKKLKGVYLHKQVYDILLEANGGENGLFNLNGCSRGKESDDGTNKRNKSVSKACINGMIIGDCLSVSSFVISVHIYACLSILSEFGVFDGEVLDSELEFSKIVEFSFL
jgi:hypothetical protein